MLPKQLDRVLLTTIFALVILGIIMVTSASGPESLRVTGDRNVFYYGLKQLIFAIFGCGLLLLMLRFPYQQWKRFSLWLAGTAIVLLILVLTPLGTNRQWINLGWVMFQPSEFAKLALIIFLAHFLAEVKQGIDDFRKGIVPPLLVAGLICLLIILEPDLGTTLVVVSSLLILLFVAGARFIHLTGLVLAGIAALAGVVAVKPYIRERLLAFFTYWQDPQGIGWQIINSLYSLGSGGLFGIGLGLSRQKFYYLPEAHTDYIFAILGEEFGLLGTTAVIGLFLVLAWRGFRIALQAPDSFGRLLAAGITGTLVFQALLNIGVVTAAFPVTGVTLPFLSYGGSSLALSLISSGILLQISTTIPKAKGVRP